MTEITPMQKMLVECDNDPDMLGERISAVLEFLTVRAAIDKPYIIYNDNETSMVLIAADSYVEDIKNSVPEYVKRWEDDLDDMPEEFITNSDPGDEQEATDEPSAEQE
jgi:hypothetical protein